MKVRIRKQPSIIDQHHELYKETKIIYTKKNGQIAIISTTCLKQQQQILLSFHSSGSRLDRRRKNFIRNKQHMYLCRYRILLFLYSIKAAMFVSKRFCLSIHTWALQPASKIKCRTEMQHKIGSNMHKHFHAKLQRNLLTG